MVECAKVRLAVAFSKWTRGYAVSQSRHPNSFHCLMIPKSLDSILQQRVVHAGAMVTLRKEVRNRPADVASTSDN